ncbi:MAG: hypothetical protein KBA49_06800 [Methanolinea sp.]|jgi:hypothetical protein|nr:hypothetical protein [Methanolinea sp.]
MNNLLLILGIIVAIFFVQGAIAADEKYSGPGWTVIIDSEPIIDPTTGEQYESLGAMWQKIDPPYWNSLTPEEQYHLNTEPAVTSGTTIIGGGLETEEQKARALELSGQTMTRAEYKAIVNPDLFEVVPESTKALWRSQKGIVSSSGVLIIRGSSTREIVTDEDGNLISGGMTPEELAFAEENCPFSEENLGPSQQLPQVNLLPSNVAIGLNSVTDEERGSDLPYKSSISTYIKGTTWSRDPTSEYKQAQVYFDSTRTDLFNTKIESISESSQEGPWDHSIGRTYYNYDSTQWVEDPGHCWNDPKKCSVLNLFPGFKLNNIY